MREDMFKVYKDNTAPLKRYLHKQTGRNWNEVYSEMCAYLKPGSQVKRRVCDHLDTLIATKVRLDNQGTLIATRWYGDPVNVVDSWFELYVDPVDGRVKKTCDLCKTKGVKNARDRRKEFCWTDGKWGPPPKPKPIKKIAPLSWHVRLKGIWYRIDLSAAPVWQNGRKLTIDELFKFLEDKTVLESDRWRVRRKHQLSCKELKTLGLKNVYDKEASYG